FENGSRGKRRPSINRGVGRSASADIPGPPPEGSSAGLARSSPRPRHQRVGLCDQQRGRTGNTAEADPSRASGADSAETLSAWRKSRCRSTSEYRVSWDGGDDGLFACCYCPHRVASDYRTVLERSGRVTQLGTHHSHSPL